jgi:hypothetical protein
MLARTSGGARGLTTNHQEVGMTKPGKNGSASGGEGTTGNASRANGGTPERGEHAPVEEQIRLRAYSFYLDRGQQPGDPLEDWLRAEREHGKRPADQASGGEMMEEPAGR